MGKIKALLIGVSEYSIFGYKDLPLCKNDLYEVKKSLIQGLNIDSNNILLCGESGKVSKKELSNSIYHILSDTTADDTFIFYFSGHGAKNCLILSDEEISLQEMIDEIAQIPAKCKIAILDSCYSGGFNINDTPQMDINETVDYFVGRGYAVMASCRAEQKSGFNDARKISLYTSFLCDAINSRFLIRKGKKSLESINETVCRLAEIYNKKMNSNIQQPIFCSNIGGTIYFDVEEYVPYKVAKIYEETDKYIIYDVEPVHHARAKRLSIKVILRFPCSWEEIAEISKEIKDKALYYEVHQNEISELRFKGKRTNIIWCYFGYDEDDMANGNFVCHTTWVDESQDKKYWYSTGKNKMIINDVHIDVNSTYDVIKELKDDSIDEDELIRKTREYTVNIISMSEQYIKKFREYLNGDFSEEKLIDELESLNKKMNKCYLEQAEFTSEAH